MLMFFFSFKCLKCYRFCLETECFFFPIYFDFLFYFLGPARSVDFFRPLFLSVSSGEYINLICPFGHNQRTESVIWYKQSVGEMPRKIGERIVYKEVKFSPEFKNSGFIMEMTDNGISLTIPNIKKDHEGLYYCGKLFTLENVTLSNGTFLAVSGNLLTFYFFL